ncbi:hypothetical protein B0D78_12520, partial [Pyramidobacter sp. C12-8]
AIKFCNFDTDKPLASNLMMGIVALDSVSIALNYVFGHVFMVSSVEDAGEVDVIFQSVWYHKVHLGISALLLL